MRGSRKWFQWSRMTPNPEFKDTPLFDVEYPGNITKQGHCYNAVQCDLLNGVISKSNHNHCYQMRHFNLKYTLNVFFGRAPPPDPLVELIALPIAPSWLTGGLGIGGWGKGKRGSGGRDKGTGILACRLPPDFWRRSAEHLHKSRSNKRSMRLRRATVVTRSSAIAERPREASCLSEVSFNCTKRRAESFIFK